MAYAGYESAMLPTRSLKEWDPASSVPTLIGSLLSVTATFSVILLWLFAGGRKRRDFRYALILNLTLAEFLNSLNNSVSGIAVSVRKEPLPPGPTCNLNGWLGQFSVQAVDFSILAIGVITLLIIQLRSFVIYASVTAKVLICLSIWIVPLCTSIFAWRKGYYGPVSGNWCWIKPQYKRQRYSLTHGWRFAILLITLCTYIFVFVYMSRRTKPQTNISVTDINDSNTNIDEDMQRSLSVCSTLQTEVHRDRKFSPLSSAAARTARIDREVWKMMLLNLYPVTYLILWLPGIANRVAEAMGRSSRVLVIMQSSTQFIGLANAALYLYKEHGKDVQDWWSGKRRKGVGDVERGVAGQKGKCIELVGRNFEERL